MPRAKHHPSTYLERHGQVNLREDDFYYSSNLARCLSQDARTCFIFVSKRKGFGSEGNRESAPMSQYGIDYLKKVFPKESFMRYKVNIYLKEKPS